MNIVFLVQGMDSGGTERVVSVLANGLGHHNIYILQLNTGPSFYKLNGNVHFDSINYQDNGLIKSLHILNSKLKVCCADVVIAMASKPIILASMARLFNHLPLITSERTDPNRYKRLIKVVLWCAYHNSTMLVCQSNYVSNYYANAIKNRTVIPNPIEIHEPRIPFNERKNVIVSVGRLVKPKNFPLLIQAFEMFESEYPNYELFIYGEGPERENLEEQINNLKLCEKVHLCGNSTHVHKDIREAKLFVCSSNIEGFPNALFEAISLGIPVISTAFPTGVSAEYINNGINGYVIPCNDANAMCERMKTILSDKDLMLQMSKNNYDLGNRFSSDTVLCQWRQLIEEIGER